jgi:hypothetical protein
MQVIVACVVALLATPATGLFRKTHHKSIRGDNNDPDRHKSVVYLESLALRPRGWFGVPRSSDNLRKWKRDRIPALEEPKIDLPPLPNRHRGYRGNFMTDGEPFVFHDPRTNTTAILCFSEKVGSTTWKQAVFKALGGSGGPTSRLPFDTAIRVAPHGIFPKKRLPSWYPSLRQMLQNPEVPRIMLVRNPCVPLTSSRALTMTAFIVCQTSLTEIVV